jgi:hypothetical protein
MLFYFACEAAGAIGARRFLYPLFAEEEDFSHNSDASRREIADVYPASFHSRMPASCGLARMTGDWYRRGVEKTAEQLVGWVSEA